MILRALPKEVRELIHGDGRSLWLLFLLSGGVAFLLGVELACLYVLGRTLVAWDVAPTGDSRILGHVFATYSREQLLLVGGSVFAVATVLRLVFQLATYHSGLQWGARVVTRLQGKLMESLLVAPTSIFDKHRPGQMLHGLMEAPMGGMFAVEALAALISNAFTAALVAVMLIYVSPWVFLGAVLVGAPTFVLVAIPLQKKLRYLKNRIIDERTGATEQAANVISGIREIKSICAERRMAAVFAETVGHAQRAFAYARFISFTPGPGLQAVFQFVFAVAMVATSLTMSREGLTGLLPQLAVIGYGLLRVYPAVSNIARSWLEIQNALPDLRVSAQWMSLPQDELTGGTESAPARFQGIHFRDVSFSYDRVVPAVTGLDFSIEPGKITCLVGGSGGGKSTILDLILKFRSPTRGVIRLGEKDLLNIIRSDWLDKVGVVRQDVFIFGGTIRENLLAWKTDATEQEMISACRQAGVLTFIDSLPGKLDTVVGDRAVTISGGQRQRIALARALLRNPQVLIIDEALSAVDGETEALVLRSLKCEFALRTIIMVSHRLASVQHSDHILVLDGGRLVEQGGHAQLMARKGRYRQLFATQLGQESATAAGQ